MGKLAIVFVLVALIVPGAQERDAPAILKDMRQALGGDAALDAVKTLALEGPIISTYNGQTLNRSHQLLAAFPDRFVRVVRLSPPGYVPMEITVYSGLNRDVPIFKIDTRGMRLKTPPGASGASPEVQAGAAIRRRQELARFSLVLLGKSIDTYPLEFTSVGREDIGGTIYDVIEATDPNRVSMRLYVDAATHLPSALSFPGEKPLPLVRPGEMAIVSLELVERHWRFSEFKKQDGLNWPRRLEELLAGNVVEDIRFKTVKINPRIDARKFDIK